MTLSTYPPMHTVDPSPGVLSRDEVITGILPSPVLRLTDSLGLFGRRKRE